MGLRELFCFIGSVSLLLPACSPLPATTDTLRSKPAGKVEFEVAQNYKPVFDLVLRQTQECYLRKPLTKQLVVTDGRDIAQRMGNVTVSLIYGPGEAETYMTTDINALADGKTKVVTYYRKRKSEAEAQAVREWVVAGSEECVR